MTKFRCGAENSKVERMGSVYWRAGIGLRGAGMQRPMRREEAVGRA